ncbi:asparaginyl-tRNA synthetase [Alkalibaculum bacchi]|uniref:Asparagine--tRNA ligase n=1 Tax=Alkalibaculum bacchi TaxID=645887 RepID=A0A366HY09_9FIRM|nr:asparagine--tRNA ligase [Alkalibaculum bacchi]RBP58725.1 asparaginyl-tRNA synthetase [Alkalibaculum bacchi]
MKTSIKQLYQNTENFSDKDIIINGWIRTNRGSKHFGFIEVNDGTYFKGVQVVYEEDIDNFSQISKLTIATAITVRGKFILTPDSKQAFEIKADEIKIEASADSSYPLQKKRHTLEYLRTIAHLRPRSNTFSAVFRVRSLVAYAVHQFFQERDFVYTHTPIITASDAEGAGEMFHVTTLDLKNPPKNERGDIDFSKDFFDKATNLTVSGQLEAEAFALAFQKVYTFGPTFRAENSNTARHAAEFWMIEPEIAFADLNDDMELAEDMIKYVINYLLVNAAEEMNFFNSFINKGLLDKLNNIVNSDFAHITYTEAIDILTKAKKEFQYPVSWGMDLQTEHERYIAEEVYKKPVFVTDYPKDIKAFYMRLNDDEKTVAAMDLLVPGVGEIIGGSQREERHDILLERMSAVGLNSEDYWWYLELRKYGGVKHAGFGLGFERAIMYMTGMENIRDVLPFPRTVGNAEF